MAKYSKKAQQKVKKVMEEMKEGKLKSGRSNKKVTVPTLSKKTGQKVRCNPVIQLSIKIFEIKMMPILTKLFAISMEPNNILGWSSKETIRLKAGCCFVLSILISL